VAHGDRGGSLSGGGWTPDSLERTRAALGDDAFTAAWQQGTLAPFEDLEADLPAAAGGSATPAPGSRA
jgi:hypothetical protein